MRRLAAAYGTGQSTSFTLLRMDRWICDRVQLWTVGVRGKDLRRPQSRLDELVHKQLLQGRIISKDLSRTRQLGRGSPPKNRFWAFSAQRESGIRDDSCLERRLVPRA